jgi:Bacterial PH domain
VPGLGPYGEYWGDRLADRLTPPPLKKARTRRVRKRLLHGQDEDEDIVDEVYRHRVVYLPAIAEAALAGLVALSALYAVGDGAALLLVVALVLLVHAGYQWLVQFLDIFVITNVRVLRVTGLLNIKQASMPLSRILDITLEQPLLGRIIRYGHFVFESAAQDQGLSDIRFVPKPLVRDQRIQTLQMDMLTGRNVKAEMKADPDAGDDEKPPMAM